VGQALLIMEISPSHSDTPQSVGLLSTSDQPDVETSTRQHNILTRERHFMPTAGFEPTIPACERPQTRPLGSANISKINYETYNKQVHSFWEIEST